MALLAWCRVPEVCALPCPGGVCRPGGGGCLSQRRCGPWAPHGLPAHTCDLPSHHPSLVQGDGGALSPSKKQQLRTENDFVRFDTAFLPKPLFFRKAKSSATATSAHPALQVRDPTATLLTPTTPPACARPLLLPAACRFLSREPWSAALGAPGARWLWGSHRLLVAQARLSVIWAGLRGWSTGIESAARDASS